MINEKIFEALVQRLMNAAHDIEHEAQIAGVPLKLKIETGPGFIMFMEDVPPEQIALAESVYPLDDPLPLLDHDNEHSEHSADTDEMIVPNDLHDLLTSGPANLPVEELMTDREKEDYKARRQGKKDTMRDGPDYTLPKKIDPNTSTI